MSELQISCHLNHKETVSRLIASGVVINEQNRRGRTALHYASGNEEIEEMLICAGADWTIKDNDGFTAGEIHTSGKSNNDRYTAIKERHVLCQQETVSKLPRSCRRTL